jgi:hypothetical protein
LNNTDIQEFEMITLRGHHLLCIQGFQGYGYSPKFVENLSQIIQILDQNPYQKIKIVDECDDICLKCPFMGKKSCVNPSGNDENIRKMDNGVINYLNLKINHTYVYHDLQKQVINETNFNDLKKICGTCTWRNDCKFYKK